MNIVRILKIMLLCLVAAVVTSCGNSRYDSLINARPDSALTLLSGIAPGEMAGSADRAYFSLLITQAKYKCYESIGSTDTIDIAVDYFDRHGDSEKRVRSLIYKGAVLDELGDKTEAMLWYKRAEEAASPDDYENLGYVNIRMAHLYSESYAESEFDIDKYKKALSYYTASKNIQYQLVCISCIGKLYREVDIDSAYRYIHRAIELATRFRDKKCEIMNYSILSRAYYEDSLYKDSKDAALYAIRNGKQYLTTNDCYYNLSRAYALLGHPDSAQCVFDSIQPDKSDPAEKVTRLITLYEIRKSEGDYKMAMRYSNMADSVSEVLEHSSGRKSIQNAENAYLENKADIKDSAHKAEKWSLIAAFIAAALSVTFLWRQWHRRQMRRFMDMMSQMREEHLEALEAHIRKEMPTVDASVALYFEKARQFVELYTVFNKRPEKLLNNFKKFVEEIQSTNFYKMLRRIVDEKYNDFTICIAQEYPSLTEQDIDVICMEICGFSNNLISFYMGYKNERYIYNKKKTILNKLGEESLDSFLLKFCGNRL